MRKLVTVVTCDICKDVVVVVFPDRSRVNEELKKTGWKISTDTDVCWCHVVNNKEEDLKP